MKSDLYCTNEYLSSYLACYEDKTFEFRKTDIGSEYADRNIKEVLIVLFLNGSFEVSSSRFNHRNIHTPVMIVFPQGDSYKIKTSDQSGILLIRLKAIRNISPQLFYDESYPTCISENDCILTIKEPVKEYISLLDLYLAEGMGCSELYEIKKEEFFLSLDLYYTRKELFRFFYPLIYNPFKPALTDTGNRNSAKHNIENIENSVLYQRLKQELKTSTREQVLTLLKKRILNNTNDQKVTPQRLMYELNCPTTEHLNTLCVKLFGMRTSKLIKDLHS